MDLALGCEGRRLCCSRDDAEHVWLRWAAGMMLVEANVTTRLLLLIWSAVVVGMVPIDGKIIAASVVVLLADSLVCV